MTNFKIEQFKVTVHDEYGDSWVLWFDNEAEVEIRMDEYPQYNYIIEDMGNKTMGLMLSLDAGYTYEILWLANDLTQSQIDAYLASNKNYLVGIVYSGKTCNELAEDRYKESLNKQYAHQINMMRSKD